MVGPSVSRTVVVYQRFGLVLLGVESVKVLPGCKERKRDVEITKA